MKVEIKNVSLKIADQIILNNISFCVESGQFISIVGPNGSGKSSLIRSMMNTASYSGAILFDNQERKKMSIQTFSKRIAILSQFHEIVEQITVDEMLEYGRLPHKSLFSKMSVHDKNVIEEIVECCDLGHLRKRMLNTLSGGEKQRVFLGMCLVQEPEVLILDEPTNHLDVYYQIQLLKIVKQLNQEKNITVICVLHDINQAIRLSDKIAMMKDGELYFYGALDTEQNVKCIEEVFQIQIDSWIDRGHVFIDCLKNLM